MRKGKHLPMSGKVILFRKGNEQRVGLGKGLGIFLVNHTRAVIAYREQLIQAPRRF